MKTKGFKAMNSDMTCRGFKFEVGKTYKHEGRIRVCGSGFHFCEELKNVYNYYSFDMNTIICEVEASDVITERDKSVCSEITILRVLDIKEILKEINFMCSHNSGSYNTGSYNTGSYNTGSDNTGSDNTGRCNRGSDNRGSNNTGSNNTGSYNRGSSNRGIFNFGSHSIGVLNSKSFIGEKENCYCFDKKTGISMIAFAKKHLQILREIKQYNFLNVSKLPNYTQKKFEVIKKHI